MAVISVVCTLITFIAIYRKQILRVWNRSLIHKYKSSNDNRMSENSQPAKEGDIYEPAKSINFSVAENISEEKMEKRLSEKIFSDISPLDQELLEKASSIIDKHIDDPLFDITTLCEEIGVGRSSLYSKFKVLTGMAPNNFIINYRLKYAAALLQRYPGLPIAEISDRSSFNSSVYFSQCFKRQYGCTPQNYQKEYAEKTATEL